MGVLDGPFGPVFVAFRQFDEALVVNHTATEALERMSEHFRVEFLPIKTGIKKAKHFPQMIPLLHGGGLGSNGCISRAAPELNVRNHAGQCRGFVPITGMPHRQQFSVRFKGFITGGFQPFPARTGVRGSCPHKR